MSEIYAMQRANGDWFALEGRDGFRVPIFSSDKEAQRTRSFTVELLVFRPAVLSERAIEDLASAHTGRIADFWLVKDGSQTMKRGVALSLDEVLAIVRKN